MNLLWLSRVRNFFDVLYFAQSRSAGFFSRVRLHSRRNSGIFPMDSRRMNPRRSKQIRLHVLASVAVLALTVAVRLPAGSERILPVDSEERTGGEETGSALLERLELRAIVTLPGATVFSLRDPEDDRAFWIEPGQSRDGIRVQNFDPDRNVVVLRLGGVEREIFLKRIRIPTGQASELFELERLQARWADREDERRRFVERWGAAVASSPELEEIQDHFRDLIGTMRELRERIEEIEEGSEPYGLLRNRQRDVASEYRLLERYVEGTIAESPAFESEDRETVDILLGLVRQSWPEIEMR